MDTLILTLIHSLISPLKSINFCMINFNVIIKFHILYIMVCHTTCLCTIKSVGLYRNLKNLNNVETTSNPYRILVESSLKQFWHQNLVETSSKPRRFLAESSSKSLLFWRRFNVEMTTSKWHRNLIDFSPKPCWNPRRFDMNLILK